MKLPIHTIASGIRVSGGTVALGLGVDAMRPGATSGFHLFHGYAGAERWSTPSTPREAGYAAATLRPQFLGRHPDAGLGIDDDSRAAPAGRSADPNATSVRGMTTHQRLRANPMPRPRLARCFQAK